MSNFDYICARVVATVYGYASNISSLSVACRWLVFFRQQINSKFAARSQIPWN